MEVKTKKTTHWFNWLDVFLSLVTGLIEKTLPFVFKFNFKRKEWKSTVDDAYNEENDPAAYSKALATIKAWEARLVFKNFVMLLLIKLTIV